MPAEREKSTLRDVIVERVNWYLKGLGAEIDQDTKKVMVDTVLDIKECDVSSIDPLLEFAKEIDQLKGDANETYKQKLAKKFNDAVERQKNSRAIFIIPERDLIVRLKPNVASDLAAARLASSPHKFMLGGYCEKVTNELLGFNANSRPKRSVETVNFRL